MKKSVALLSLIVVSVLIISLSFVSASWFGDFLGKITGKAAYTPPHGVERSNYTVVNESDNNSRNTYVRASSHRASGNASLTTLVNSTRIASSIPANSRFANILRRLGSALNITRPSTLQSGGLNTDSNINYSADCYCASCAECQYKIKSACATITLSRDAVNCSLNMASNKILNCNGYSTGSITLSRVNNAAVKNCKASGISLSSYSNNNNISQNNVNGGIGVSWNSNYNTVSNNIILGAGGSGDGISVDFSNFNKVINNQVSNNFYGISLFQASNNTLSNNVVSDSRAAGIELSGSSSYNTISNNALCSRYSAWEVHILDSGSVGNVLSGNTCPTATYGNWADLATVNNACTGANCPRATINPI